jgi:hypothetical protein
MMDSTADEDFPPNPFRSGGQQQQQQPPQQTPSMLSPVQQQQQQQHPLQPQQQEEQDFFTNPAPVDPLSTPAPIQQQQRKADGIYNTSGNTLQAPPQQLSWWQSCRACCTMQTYAQYFDVDTVDIKTRLMGALLHFYQPDYFRTNVIGIERNTTTEGGLKGPDLYGPFWITMTVVFSLAVTSNIAAYLHSDNIDEFEFDISHLMRALTILSTWSFAIPTLFWLTTRCMGMNALYLVDWVCLYGYSMLPLLPATVLCLIPSEIVMWVVLAVATAVSGILVLRNVAGPLLASDVSQSKSGPLLLAILGMHVILLLTLKLAFYK